MSEKQGEFIEAARKEFESRLQRFQRRLMLDMYRDAIGLPTKEQEMGWRWIFRAKEGGK